MGALGRVAGSTSSSPSSPGTVVRAQGRRRPLPSGGLPRRIAVHAARDCGGHPPAASALATPRTALPARPAWPWRLGLHWTSGLRRHTCFRVGVWPRPHTSPGLPGPAGRGGLPTPLSCVQDRNRGLLRGRAAAGMLCSCRALPCPGLAGEGAAALSYHQRPPFPRRCLSEFLCAFGEHFLPLPAG